MSLKEVDPPVSGSQSAVKGIMYAVVILLILASVFYAAVLYPTDQAGFVMALAVTIALSFGLLIHRVFDHVLVACIPVVLIVASAWFAALTGLQVWVGVAIGFVASFVGTFVGAAVAVDGLAERIDPDSFDPETF